MEKLICKKLNAIIMLLSSIIILTTCEKEKEFPTYTGHGNIGPEGGIVNTTDGASVFIPVGALTDHQPIAISRNTSEKLGLTSDIWAYDLQPDGLKFKDSVTITLPFNDKFIDRADSLDINPIRVFLMKDTTFIELETKIDWEKKQAEIKSMHFSTYIITFPSEWGTYFKTRGDKDNKFPVPYYKQSGNWCFYYSLSMILKNAGYSFKGPNLASLFLERNPYKTGYIYLLDNLPFAVFKNLGLECELKGPWFNQINLFGYIIYCLDNNVPVELGVVPEHHAVVVTGYNKFGLFYQDPAEPSAGIKHRSFQEISSVISQGILNPFCNTVTIKSTGTNSKSSYTLDFHSWDFTIKENPSDKIIIGIH